MCYPTGLYFDRARNNDSKHFIRHSREPPVYLWLYELWLISADAKFSSCVARRLENAPISFKAERVRDKACGKGAVQLFFFFQYERFTSPATEENSSRYSY